MMSITPKPPQIIPYFFYRDVGAALDFLCRAFGFKEAMRVGTPGGGVHGEASFQGQLVMMGQGAHERSMRSPRDAGAAMGVFIDLDDVDKRYEVAKAAGAEIVHPPKDVKYGGLTGRPIPRSIPGSSQAPKDAVNRGGVRILFILAALTLAVFPAVAGQPAALCAAAKKSAQADPLLAAAVAAAFGKATFKATAEDCVYPLKVLHYATADVLIVQAGEPGHACHGCASPLSAYVLRRLDDGLKLVRAFHKFATLGTFGAVDDISPIEIGGDDGMAIKSGGMFQGYSFAGVDFFAFHAGQLIILNNTPITVADDNSGAILDPGKTVEVTAKWFLDPDDKAALIVDYEIKAHGAKRVERVVWRLQGTSLILSHGHVPPEVLPSSGGG
jgi:PhnB protein